MDQPVPRFSGALGRAPLLVPLAMLLAVPLLSLVYAYVDVYSPIAGWISILFTAGFGIALGWSVGKAGYLAHCRNPRFLRVMGATAGLLGLYVSWAWFEYALLHRGDEPADVGFAELVTRPALMWAIAQSIAEVGWYTIQSATPSGAVLWILWALEALGVVGLAAAFAPYAIRAQVFCEGCERWCEAAGAPKKLALPGPEAEAPVRAGDVMAIAGLSGAQPDESDHLVLDVRRCSRCRETGALRLQRARTTLDRKGKPQRKLETWVDYAQRTPAELERLSA